MRDPDGVVTITLKNYSTSKVDFVTDKCWFDLFQGNRCCLRIAFRRTKRVVTFNQVVKNAWTEEVWYNVPADLEAGRDVALRIYYYNGKFTVAFNDMEADLDWRGGRGAIADLLEYRADHASDAIFRDSVPAQYSWNSSLLDVAGKILGDPPAT
jgi:hypothetical protein